MRGAVATFAGACVLMVVAAATARPPEPDIRVEFESDRVVAGRPFRMEISVTAEGEGEPSITLPAMPGVEILDKSVSRPASGYSFSFSFGTGQGAQKVVRNSGTWVYTLIARAQKPGTISVGPVKVKLDGHTFAGKVYPLEVVHPSAAGQVSPDATDAVAHTSNPDVSLALKNVRIDPDYFLHMVPSKEECLVGELIVLDIYLFTSVRGIRAEQFDREPGTEGFWVERFEDMDGRSSLQTDRVVLNGEVYEQVLLNRLALFPLKTGELTISPAVFSFSVGGGFFSMGKSVKRSAQPVTIRVNPLPEDGRPADFNGANVGQYSFHADVSARAVKAGEPVTLTLTVKGRGNVRNTVLPALGDLNGVKVYPPETTAEVTARERQVSGMNQSRVLLIPEKEGRFEIPSLQWSYFDVVAGRYVEKKTEPIEVTVSAGAPVQPGGKVVSAGGPASTEDSALDRMNQRMRTIASGVDVSMSSGHTMNEPWFLAIVFGVPCLFIGMQVVTGLRRRASRQFEKGRSRRASAVARKALSQLGKDAGASKERFYGELQRVLITLVEDRLEEVAAGDTMVELQARLMARGIPGELAADVVRAVEECEFARFAKSNEDGASRAAVLARAMELVGRMDAAPLSPAEGGTP